MTTFITDRRQITGAILKQINPDYSDSDIEIALYKWWRNPRSSGGLRLTETGVKYFEMAGIEHIDFAEGKENFETDTKFILALDRKLPSPYALIYKDRLMHIRLYDSRVSLMVMLHESFRTYLNTLDDR